MRLDKAHEDLDTARELLVGARHRAAISRAYYACFHATSAALLWAGVERAKHSGVQSAFGEFLIRPGHIEVEYSHIFRRARESREEQDYSTSPQALDEAAATQLVQDAERFVARLERYLRDAGGLE